MKTSRFLVISVLLISLNLLSSGCALHQESMTDGKLLFRSSRNEGCDLFVMNPDGSNSRKLVDFPSCIPVPNDNNGFVPSPNGKQVAFISDRDGNLEIYTVDLKNGVLSNLTNSAANETCFAWSPDGKQMVFVSDRDNIFLNAEHSLATNNIYIMESDGSKVRRWTVGNETNQYGSLSWSPDGEKLAFSMSTLSPYGPFVSGIYLMNIHNFSLTRLTAPSDLVQTNPIWAPSGEQVMYFVMGSMLSDVNVVSPDGTNQIALTEKNLGFVISASWSPSGKQILLSTKKDGGYFIHTVESTGVNLVTLSKQPLNFDTSPSWSPDGKYIVFSSKRNDNEYHLYIMNKDGTNQTRLTNGPGEEFSPIWLP